ncbi:MAG: DegV family protein [bacterium]
MCVKVLTDSTSCIDKTVRDQLNIDIVSLSVEFKDSTYKETELDNEHFYKMMAEKGIPKSSQPSIGNLYAAMENIIKKGHALLCIFISSELSGTYAAATIARDMIIKNYPQAAIEVIDSRSVCMQLGFAAMAAARAAKAEKSLAAARNAALQIMKKNRFLFIPETLEYLEKGGRIGKAQALIGNFLKIVPILTVEDGITTVFKKVRTQKKALETIVEQTWLDIKNLGLGEIIVHHINCKEKAKELVAKIKEKIDVDIQILDISPVIGLHVGPGAIGVVYYTQKDIR